MRFCPVILLVLIIAMVAAMQNPDTVPLVTAIDRAFLPGVKALYNSFVANAGDGFELHCIVHGDDALFDEVAAHGITAIHATDWADEYPTSHVWPERKPALFASLQVPKLFAGQERVIWIDADCIIVDSLNELATMEFLEPVAACHPHHMYTLEKMVLGCDKSIGQVHGLFSGFYVYNVQEWNRLDITGKCAQAMTDTSVTFKWCDQSVLSYVLRGNFCELDIKWQTFANRQEAQFHNAKILHWLGTMKPWNSAVPHQHRWEVYR